MTDMEILREAEERAAERGEYETFSWKQLFGEKRWEELSEGNPTGLGDRLSKDVAAGRAPTIEYVGIARSGRMNLFRRKLTEPIE